MATFQTKPDKKHGGVKGFVVTSQIKDGKRNRVWIPLGTFPTTRDAKTEFNRVNEDLSRKEVQAIHRKAEMDRTTPNLAEAIPIYLEENIGIKLNSSKGNRHYIRLIGYCGQHLGQYRLNEIDP